MRAFLDRVSQGSVRMEYEDWKGLPDRWWRTAVRWAPPLSVLGFLPRYSFVTAAVAVVAYLLYKLFTFDYPEEDYGKRD